MNNHCLENVEQDYEASGGDAGLCFKGTCPTCKEEIKVGEHSWWDTTCFCGIIWHLEIEVIGYKNNGDTEN